jgi:pimeloyl-ACP methyl ester carboxylesterase
MASKEIDYNGTRFTLSYELRNPSAQDSLLILHGWGSNKALMLQAFGSLLPSYKHIYLDMPGFGNSPNDTVLTTHDYAAIVERFLDALGAKPRIVMGHSFGGKVATLLDPPCLVLLSSSGIRVPKPLKVRLKIALFKALKPLGLTKLRDIFVSDDAKGMSPAMYETFKNVVNEDFEAHFSDVTGEALLFWGKEDTATPLWTAEAIAEKSGNARVFPLEGDHYFFLHHAPFIAQTVQEHCKG